MALTWPPRLQRLPPQSRTILSTALFGLCAGLAAVAFQVSVKTLFVQGLARLSGYGNGAFIIGSFAVVMGTAVIAGLLLTRFCREAAGSGIPQVKLAFWKEFGAISWRAVWVKFIASAISIGGGSSLGREGPSVHIASGLASNLAGWLGQPKQKRRRAAAAGAAAGLAAAFNTPLAAVTFVLEEIMEDLNSRLLGSVLLAGVIGALVVHGLIGRQPAFALGTIDAPTWRAYLLTPLAAGFAALVGVLFQKGALGLRGRQHRMHAVPPWLRPCLGAFVTWVLGVLVFLCYGRLGVFGLGYEDLSEALNHRLPWTIAAVLLIAKLAATIACYGFGGAGGIFSPTLCFGGMTGVFLGGVFGLALQLHPADYMTLAVVGMSACLGAVVRAPVTGILIVFEMTHEFPLLPALMLGALVSQAVARRCTQFNFYEAILRQDGHILEHVMPPRDLQSWQQLPVAAIANFHPVVIADLNPTSLQAQLKEHPFQRFPVLLQGKLAGILTRKEAELALAQGRTPNLEPAITCNPAKAIRELQQLLVESTTLFIVVQNVDDGAVHGIVTLHDVLRAELRLANDPG
jgi:CIC family chloride channel protein